MGRTLLTVAVASRGEGITPPRALFVLHPPVQVPASAGYEATASDVMLLRGVPELGLAHQAIWVEVERADTVARLVTAGQMDPREDPDVAVLVTLLAT